MSCSANTYTKSADFAIAHLHLRTLALAPFSNKQQRNLRRYDDIPAKNGRACMNVIPVGIYCYFVVD